MAEVDVIEAVAERDPPSAASKEVTEPVDRSGLWFWAALAIAVGVVVLVGIRAAVDGWLPVGDEGYFALRSRDVFSRHPPLLGTASSASTYSGSPTSHPGPLQFFVLAVPVAVLGVGAGTVIGTALINAISIGATVALVRSRLGVVAGAVSAVCLVGLAWAIGSVILHDPWGPFAVVLPFALFVVAVGLAAGGEARVLPVAAFVGSLVLQTHASYVLLVPGLALVGVIGVLLHDRTRATLRWVGLAAGVTLLCWIPPLVQQVRNEPGNLVALWQAAHAEGPGSVSVQQAVYIVAGTVALPPFWFPPGFENAGPLYNSLDSSQRMPVGNVAAAVVVLLLAVATVSAWRRRDRIVLGALATAIVGLVLAWVSILRAPAYGVWGASYTRYLWPLSLWVWFSLGLAAVRAWSPSGRLGALGRVPVRAVLAGLTALVLVIAVATVPHRDTSFVERDGWQERAQPVVDAVLGAVDDLDGPVLIRGTVTEANFTYAPLLMAELVDHGRGFLVDDATVIRQVGAHRAVRGDRRPVAEVWLVQVPDETIGGRILYQDGGLAPAEAAELDDLTRQLTADARRHADDTLELSSAARAYVEEVHPEDVAKVQDQAATRPLTPQLMAEIDDTVGGKPLRWSDRRSDALDHVQVARWRKLTRQRDHNQVVVYLKDLTRG